MGYKASKTYPQNPQYDKGYELIYGKRPIVSPHVAQIPDKKKFANDKADEDRK